MPPTCRILLLGLLSTVLPLRAADQPLQITVESGDWGSASRADIRAVLLSAAGELWKHCPQTKIDPILVIRREKYPQTNFERDPQGRIVVGLNTKDKHWAQFAFQFAHEFAHVLAAHSQERGRQWHDTHHANMWLEESLCETASLFALHRMNQDWETAPPYPNWKSYAVSLGDYVKERMGDPRNSLPAGTTFSAWFQENETALRANPVMRDKNLIVASALLPLFEAEPAGWETLTFLNLVPREATKPLPRQLADWRAAAPPAMQPFITKLAAVFGIKL